MPPSPPACRSWLRSVAEDFAGVLDPHLVGDAGP
jgi:hypothetical protein